MVHGYARPAVLEPLWCVSHLGCGCLLVAQPVWRAGQLRSLPFVWISTLLSVGMVLAVAVTVTMVLVTVVVEMARMVMTVVLMGVVMGAVVKMAAVGGWLRAHPWNLMAWIQIPAVPLLIG